MTQQLLTPSNFRCFGFNLDGSAAMPMVGIQVGSSSDLVSTPLTTDNLHQAQNTIKQMRDEYFRNIPPRPEQKDISQDPYPNPLMYQLGFDAANKSIPWNGIRSFKHYTQCPFFTLFQSDSQAFDRSGMTIKGYQLLLFLKPHDKTQTPETRIFVSFINELAALHVIQRVETSAYDVYDVSRELEVRASLSFLINSVLKAEFNAKTLGRIANGAPTLADISLIFGALVNQLFSNQPGYEVYLEANYTRGNYPKNLQDNDIVRDEKGYHFPDNPASPVWPPEYSFGGYEVVPKVYGHMKTDTPFQFKFSIDNGVHYVSIKQTIHPMVVTDAVYKDKKSYLDAKKGRFDALHGPFLGPLVLLAKKVMVEVSETTGVSV